MCGPLNNLKRTLPILIPLCHCKNLGYAFIKLELDFRNKAWIFYYYYYLFNSVNFQGLAAYHVAFHENYLAGRFHTNKKTDSFFIKRF